MSSCFKPVCTKSGLFGIVKLKKKFEALSLRNVSQIWPFFCIIKLKRKFKLNQGGYIWIIFLQFQKILANAPLTSDWKCKTGFCFVFIHVMISDLSQWNCNFSEFDCCTSQRDVKCRSTLPVQIWNLAFSLCNTFLFLFYSVDSILQLTLVVGTGYSVTSVQQLALHFKIWTARWVHEKFRCAFSPYSGSLCLVPWSST